MESLVFPRSNLTSDFIMKKKFEQLFADTKNNPALLRIFNVYSVNKRLNLRLY